MIQKNYQLLTIGHLNYDYIINTQKFTGVNASQTIDNLQKYDGGAAANAALVAAETVPSAFYTIVGEDFQKSQYFQKIKNHENCLGILERVNDKTSICFVITDNNSDCKRVCLNGASDRFLNLEAPKRYIDKAKIIHITTVPPVFALKCAKYASEKGITVSFNPGQSLRLYSRKQMMEMLEYVDFIFGNEYEIDYIYNELNLRVLRDYHVPYMITTQGDKGSLIECSVGSAWNILPYKTKLIDSTGAEDAYIGAFLAAYLEKKDINECGHFASATSSFITEKEGCQTNIPTLQQVNERLNNEEQNT